MKKGTRFALSVFLLTLLVSAFAGEAAAAALELRAENFRRGANSKGEWTIIFDIVATNNGDERVITRIYDFSCRIEGDAKDMRSGKVYRMSRAPAWPAPSKFRKMELWPGESAKDSFTVNYTSFKHSKWRWEGEQKNKNFYMRNIKVSNLKFKYNSKQP